MKSIERYLNEALIKKGSNIDMTPPSTAKKDSKKWVAVEVKTQDHFDRNKVHTSQRVVTVETYWELRNKDYTRGMMKILGVTQLSPVCGKRENAESYLDPVNKTKRKSKINKGDADYITWCISIGSMNPSGSTKWDWNFWEEFKDAEIYMGYYGRSFLVGAPGSFKVGDKVLCVDNDSEKKLPGAPDIIEAVSKCDIDEFRKVFRNKWPNLCKSPKRAFGKISDGLPWGKMGQIYSIKGIATDAN